MNFDLTPYQEWLVLRRLVKENNESIRFYALKSNLDIDDLPEVYKSIGENFMCKDNDAMLIYEDKCKKNWIDCLSRNDLFKLFNFQNKVLKMSKERFITADFDYFGFFVANNCMDYFDDKIEFSGKPNKQEKDNRIFSDTFEDNIVSALQSNYERVCSEYKKNNNASNIDIESIGDLKGFEFRNYNNLVKKSLYKKKEEELKKQESEKKKMNETPIFPEFEEFFKKNQNTRYNFYEEEFIK